MSAPTAPGTRPVTVAGGGDPIDVRYADLIALETALRTAADDCARTAGTLRAYLDDPDLAGSSRLDPVGYDLFESALLDAIGSTGGLGAVCASAHSVAGDLHDAVIAYEHVDRWLGSATGGATSWLSGVVRLPGAVGLGLAELLSGAGARDAGQEVAAYDPALADLVMGAGGLKLGSWLGSLVPDGRGVVTDPGVDARGVAGRPPRGLHDVVGDLAQRDDSPADGAIDVRVLTMADGTRRAIVDVTGTKSWTQGRTDDVTSLTTNERAITGRRTAYEGGVLAAMRAAGVQRTDKVMIVGHSEGGMVAVNAARDAVHSGEFDVTHVVTAGAPIGRIAATLPRHVDVLALENRHDVVPHLDAADNPRTANVVTVTGRRGDGTIVGDHDLRGSYLPLAADTEAGHDPAITRWEAGAGGYFRATHVTTHTYRIRRSYS